MKAFQTIFLSAFLTILISSGAIAQTFTHDQKETLRDLSRVLLVVEFAQASVEMDGLNRTELEIEIATRLRAGGIRLMNETTWSQTPGVPYLYVLINTVKSDLGFYSYYAEVKLNQEVIMVRNRNLSNMSTTWETTSLGFIGVNRIGSLRQEILELVDIFIEDYRAVNS